MRVRSSKRPTRSKKSTRSMRSKKPTRSIRLTHAPRVRKSTRAPLAQAAVTFPWSTNAAAIALAVICVGTVMLIAAPQSPQWEDAANVPASLETNARSTEAAAWPQPQTNRAIPSTKPQAVAAAETIATDTPPAHWPAAELAEAPRVAAATWPALGPTEKPEVQTASVTITGCLDLDDERFRLTDTAGTDAPKSRSWKSGFLKKRPAPIELVDTDNSVKLSTYLGHRVAATGTLVNREMQVRSLHRVAAASCS